MPKGYHHLTRDQRGQIYILKVRGDTIPTIADELGVDRSTVYREIKRNRGNRGYRFKQASEKADKRRYQASSMKRKLTSTAIAVIEKKLKLQWSPEQIAGWLKKMGYEKPVSHETIYQHVWKEKRQGGLLYKELSYQHQHPICSNSISYRSLISCATSKIFFSTLTFNSPFLYFTGKTMW